MSSWKTPDEIIRLQRLKQRTKALQARIDGRSSTRRKKTPTPTKADPQKRKNPFADKQSTPKRLKAIATRTELQSDHSNNEDSIFAILSSAHTTTDQSASDQQNAATDIGPATSVRQLPQRFPAASDKSTPTSTDALGNAATVTAVPAAPPQTFMQFIVPDTHAHHDDDDGDSNDAQQTPTAHVPIDWGLKTKLRLLTLSPLTGNGLKACQEASGITSFVRCLTPDTASDGFDLSMGALFHQATMYWQHPHIPWLTLFPRNGRSNGDFTFGEPEREALAKDWTESFRALFQLLRVRQCPYFYVCANSYNVLFCAAGIGGRVEQHAYLTPTSRGMRAALKQEEINFVMPLKAMPGNGAGTANRSLDSGVESTSFSNGSDEGIGATQTTADDADSDDEDQDEWLASLGVEASEIRKIGSVNARVQRNIECAEDFSDHSIALIEGVECQAFFNFLLNSKSTITKTGRLAGVPPTLLAPVAFPGSTLRSVQTRASQIRMDGVEYHSLELRGVVLPHVLPYLCGLMRESKDTFSASLTDNAGTNAFSKAAQRLMEDKNEENDVKALTDQVFGRKNLTDCGLSTAVLQAMCRNAPDAVRCLERMCFNKEVGGYTWN